GSVDQLRRDERHLRLRVTGPLVCCQAGGRRSDETALARVRGLRRGDVRRNRRVLPETRPCRNRPGLLGPDRHRVEHSPAVLLDDLPGHYASTGLLLTWGRPMFLTW